MATTEATGQSPPANPLEDELRQERDMRLRALADFDNYRKRVERDRATAIERGRRDLMMKLLDLADDFERALQHAADAPDAAWVEGVESIYRRLLALLGAQGVAPFESLGKPFDPGLHEAIGQTDNDRYEPGTVAEEVQRGYRWGDELLRPARVRVAR